MSNELIPNSDILGVFVLLVNFDVMKLTVDTFLSFRSIAVSGKTNKIVAAVNKRIRSQLTTFRAVNFTMETEKRIKN